MNDYLANEIDLYPLLPPTVNDFKEFQEIARVESDNFNKARLHLINIFKFRFVHETDEKGVLLWEKMLKLKRRTTDTLEERKNRILTKINNKLPYTMRTLKQLLNSLCGEENYNVLLNPHTYELHFEFYNKITDVHHLKKTLEDMIPLNLWLHFLYVINVPAVKVSARDHVYPVVYAVTNQAITTNNGIGVSSESKIDIPSKTHGYKVIYPVTGMAFSY